MYFFAAFVADGADFAKLLNAETTEQLRQFAAEKHRNFGAILADKMKKLDELNRSNSSSKAHSVAPDRGPPKQLTLPPLVLSNRTPMLPSQANASAEPQGGRGPGLRDLVPSSSAHASHHFRVSQSTAAVNEGSPPMAIGSQTDRTHVRAPMLRKVRAM